MAVDTRNKRFAILQMYNQAIQILPNPDGTIDEPDRSQYAHMYNGIDLQGAIIVLEPDRIPSGAKKGHRLGGKNTRRGRSLG